MTEIMKEQETTMMSFDAPSTPLDAQFIETALGDLQSTVRSLDNDHALSNAAFTFIVSEVCEKLQRWLRLSVLNDYPRWDTNVRLINVLRAGVADGMITFKTTADLYVFSQVAMERLWLFPEAMAHYAETGEILELMSILSEEGKENASAYVDAKMLRLYDYDMRTPAEQPDAEDMGLIPLDIRLSFSGFYEDCLSDEEKKRSDIIYEQRTSRSNPLNSKISVWRNV